MVSRWTESNKRNRSLRVGENSLGVNAGLVRKGAEASDIVVERNGDLNSIGHQIFDISQRSQVVLGLDTLRANADKDSVKNALRN